MKEASLGLVGSWPQRLQYGTGAEDALMGHAPENGLNWNHTIYARPLMTAIGNVGLMVKLLLGLKAIARSNTATLELHCVLCPPGRLLEPEFLHFLPNACRSVSRLKES